MRLLKYRLTIIISGCLLLVTALAVAACQGNNPVADNSRRTLELSLKETPADSPGRLTLELLANNTGELYQLAGRLTFDETCLQPVDARRGALVDDRAAFMALTSQPGLVPFAFTYHEGEQIPAGSGVLLTLEFEILDPAGDNSVELVTDPEFLVARSLTGSNLELKVVASR